jgi:hypothetical protein
MLHNLGRHISVPAERDALKLSRLALHFIMGRGESSEFERYLKGFDIAPRADLLSFTTKEEADTWLQNHPAPPHGATIRAANELYTVAYLPSLSHRKLLWLPPDEELEQADEGSMEEVRSPPPSSPPQGNDLDFALERLLYHLHELEGRTTSPEQREAIKIAKIALHFILHVGEQYGFEDYLEYFKSDSPPSPLVSFATQEDADTWLKAQPVPPPPSVVGIGSDIYSVGFNRRRELRVLIRIPTRQELGATD